MNDPKSLEAPARAVHPAPGSTVEPLRGRVPFRPPPGLHVVATPIGNRGDITLRALDTLAAADLIVCEDSRVSGPLLSYYGIARPLLAYHDHNGARMRPRILAALTQGQIVALISDAGTPLLADPGYKLVVAAWAAGVSVFTIPGPSAVVAALSIAGQPTDQFFFAGFLPPRSPARRRALEPLAAIPATLVFLEAPQRLAASLADMAAVLGPRPAAVARELTKLHEEVVRAPLDALAQRYASSPPKGEIVVVVGPPVAAAPAVGGPDIDQAIARALDEDLSLKDAVSRVARELGLARRAVYARALALKQGLKP